MDSTNRTRLGVVTACTVGHMVGLTPVVHATFGTFLMPLADEFGWPRASISGVLGILAVAGAILIPLAGRYADKNGGRRMILIGNLLLAGSIALLALSDGNILHFYLSFALVAIAGAVPSTAAIMKMVSDWFDRTRGTMLGISAGVGNGLGATLMPIAAAVMLSAFGWRGAYVGLGLIVAIVGFPVMYFLLKDAPRYVAVAGEEAPVVDGLTLGEALRTPVFWLLMAAIASGAGCLTAVFSHVVPILAERGIGLGISTAVLSVFAIVCAMWQIGSGTLLDKAPTPKITAPMYLAAVAGLAVIEMGTGTAVLLMGGALLGIGLGTQYGALPFFIARYFGVKNFGTIIGAMYSAVIILQGVTPILLDHAFDVQGTYRFAIMAIGLCLTGGAALLLMLPAYRDVEVKPVGLAPAHV